MPADPETTPELVLLVRRPPGRGHLYRFAGPRITVGTDADDPLWLEGPDITAAHLLFERTADGYRVQARAPAALNGQPLPPGEARPVHTADALELGDRLIEVAIEHGPAPTTDRQDAGRLRRAQQAEQRVRAAAGPSLWVLRGAASGLAVPVDATGVVCGSASDDGLRLPDAGVEPGHFTVRAEGDTVLLSARASVRVRGRPVREARLRVGDVIFVGPAVCEVRGPSSPTSTAPPTWPIAAVIGAALALLAAAWWTAL